jgi:hypothetical protein
MKKTVILSITLMAILLMAMLLPGCQQENKPAPVPPKSGTKGRPTAYSNSKYGFSFSICNSRDFEFKENYVGAIATLLGPLLKDLKHQIVITVIIIKVPNNTKLEDYLQAGKKAGENTLANFAITDESDTVIGGIPAKLQSINYTLNIDNEDLAFKDILAVFMKDNNIYAIKYEVPAEFHDQYVDCFNLILSTFRFK